jgi:hypothetical protein
MQVSAINGFVSDDVKISKPRLYLKTRVFNGLTSVKLLARRPLKMLQRSGIQSIKRKSQTSAKRLRTSYFAAIRT